MVIIFSIECFTGHWEAVIVCSIRTRRFHNFVKVLVCLAGSHMTKREIRLIGSRLVLGRVGDLQNWDREAMG